MSLTITTVPRLSFVRASAELWYADVPDGTYSCAILDPASRLWSSVFDPTPTGTRLNIGASFNLRQCMYQCDRQFFISGLTPPASPRFVVCVVDYFVLGTIAVADADSAYVWPNGQVVGYGYI